MFEISVRSHFSAAHRLVGHEGACAHLHGHNWEVEVFVAGERLNAIGVLVDFRHVKTALQEVMSTLDHRDLNALPELGPGNPTSENLARHLFEALAARLDAPGCRVARVRVSETPGTSATYHVAPPDR